MTIIRPKTNWLHECASDINTIMKALQRLNVSFFSHTRIFDDGSRFDLNNHPAMLEEFYFGKAGFYKSYVPEINPREQTNELIFLDSLHNNQSIEFLRHGYGVDHLVAKIDKHEGYCDVWNFGSAVSNTSFYADFIAHLDVIEKFIAYYLERAERLIQQSSNDPIIILPEKNKKSKSLEIQAPNWTSLTPLENHYCQLLAQGLTRQQIAKQLFKSVRTVDTHIQNIRIKLACNNSKELLVLLKTRHLRF